MTEDGILIGKGEKAVDVTITGRPPGLMMNNWKSMMAGKGKSGSCSHGIPWKTACPECLEVRTYRVEEGPHKGELYIPSNWIHASIGQSAGSYRVGRRSAAGIVWGTVRVEPFQLALGTKDYVVDQRRAIRGKEGVVAHRPLIPKWEASFTVVWDPSFGIESALLREIVEGAGRRLGIGDYRPQHRGPFGTFTVSKWEVRK